jgi:predicted HTH domain antitoxin
LQRNEFRSFTGGLAGKLTLTHGEETMSAVTNTVTVEISQDILDAARLTAAELKLEVAVALYARGKLSLGKARELADMTLWEFRQSLAARRIAPHLDIADIDADIATLHTLERL